MVCCYNLRSDRCLIQLDYFPLTLKVCAIFSHNFIFFVSILFVNVMVQWTGNSVVSSVHIDPGKSWKVMEFKIQIFQAWKVMELDLCPGKSRKVVENKPNVCHISDPCTFLAFTYIIIVHRQTGFDLLFSIIMNCYVFNVINVI